MILHILAIISIIIKYINTNVCAVWRPVSMIVPLYCVSIGIGKYISQNCLCGYVHFCVLV